MHFLCDIEMKTGGHQRQEHMSDGCSSVGACCHACMLPYRDIARAQTMLPLTRLLRVDSKSMKLGGKSTAGHFSAVRRPPEHAATHTFEFVPLPPNLLPTSHVELS